MSGRFATIDSLRRRDENEDDNEDDRNEYYAGGIGRDGGSGLAVVGGPNDRRRHPAGSGGPGGPVEDIFQRAESSESAPLPAAGARRTITMYREGFTVDDGPFRRLDDEANAPFLQDLSQGIVPRELKAVGDVVEVSLVDKRKEDYVAPAYIAYGGSGQTAGGGTVRAAAIVTGGDEVESPTVDASAPTTTLQIRLHDGRRIRSTLNLTHTAAHVQAIIRSEGAGGAPYMLLHGFPPVQITDFSQSLEQAGLKGAAITQKLA